VRAHSTPTELHRGLCDSLEVLSQSDMYMSCRNAARARGVLESVYTQSTRRRKFEETPAGPACSCTNLHGRLSSTRLVDPELVSRASMSISALSSAPPRQSPRTKPKRDVRVRLPANVYEISHSARTFKGSRTVDMHTCNTA